MKTNQTKIINYMNVIHNQQLNINHATYLADKWPISIKLNLTPQYPI